MDQSRSIILFQSIGLVHVLDRDVDGLWVVLIARNQSVVVSLLLIGVAVYLCNLFRQCMNVQSTKH